MPRKFVDLSIPLETGVASDPPFMLPEIDYFDHSMTAGQMADFFPGLQRGTCREATDGRSRRSGSRATTEPISTRRITIIRL